MIFNKNEINEWLYIAENNKTTASNLIEAFLSAKKQIEEHNLYVDYFVVSNNLKPIIYNYFEKRSKTGSDRTYYNLATYSLFGVPIIFSNFLPKNNALVLSLKDNILSTYDFRSAALINYKKRIKCKILLFHI